MDDTSIYWDLFENSGRVDAYLAYKKIKKEEIGYGPRKSSWSDS